MCRHRTASEQGEDTAIEAKRKQNADNSVNAIGHMKMALIGICTYGLIIIVVVLVVINIVKAPTSVTNIESTGYAEYVTTPKSLFVWGPSTTAINTIRPYEMLLDGDNALHQKHLAQFCATHGVKNIKVYVGCAQWDGEDFTAGVVPHTSGLTSLIQELDEISPETTLSLITYINDDRNNMSGWERIPELTEAILQLNQSLRRADQKLAIQSLLIDQVTTDIEEYENLIVMARKVREKVDLYTNSGQNSEFFVEMTIQPLWLSQIWKDTTTDGTSLPFAQHLLRAIGAGVITSYSNTLYKIEENAKLFYLYASKENSRASVAIQTGTDNVDTSETLASFIEYPSEWFTTAPNFFKAIQEACPSNEMTVIHDYAQYHQLLYTTQPYNTPVSKLNYLSSK